MSVKITGDEHETRIFGKALMWPNCGVEEE